jgi:CRISPR-associated protein Csd1
VTVLQALNAYYERMAARGEAEPPGFSREKISFSITLSAQGEPVAVRDLREEAKGKRLVPKALSVPAAVKRTVAILPNLFWDKSAYVLGRTAGDGKRTALEHAAFKTAHRDLLAGASDPGLVALSRFLDRWSPERFDAAPFSVEMLDANIVFSLDGETRYLHQREAAQALLAARAGGEGLAAFCLVTGRQAPVQRLHPTIKGVDGAQTAGAALVSFNLDAFASYGKEQGDNAPTSEAAAFRYGAALNALLDRSASRNRLRRGIGDATIVFWADASRAEEEAAAKAAEDWFASMVEPPNDEGEASKLRDALARLAGGEPVASLDPGLEENTAFHVLGLAPNAARLSVRYWLTDSFGSFARRLAEHHADLAIEPSPWRSPPSLNWLLMKTTALQEKAENVLPLLAGEVMRAVLEGGRYPRSLLAAAMIRLRAGDDPASGWHAAVIKAVLARDHRLKVIDKAEPESPARAKEKPPVSLDRDNENPAYQLGRLFAAFETAQRLALGPVNATIRDRYFGAASATPASVFPLLMRGVQSHLGKLRKEGKGRWLEREIEDINDKLGPSLPRALRLEAQGRFVLGYYHQRKGQFANREAQAETAEIDQENDDDAQ